MRLKLAAPPTVVRAAIAAPLWALGTLLCGLAFLLGAAATWIEGEEQELRW